MKDRLAFVHFVKSRKKIKNNGIFPKWKPITLLLGMRAEKRLQRIARCCVKKTTEPNLESNCMGPILQGSFADNAIGENNLLITRARVGRGKRYVFCSRLPLQKNLFS